MRQVIEGLRILAITLLLSGCITAHPLNVDPSQVYDLGPDEGIVFGSVRVEIAKEGGGFGRRAARSDYRLTISPARGSVALTPSAIIREELRVDEQWELLVSPGEERTFVARLPSGYKNVDALHLKPKSIWATSGDFGIQASFRVTSGGVTYIGRLVLVLPERLINFSTAHVRVEDSLARDQAALGGDYGELFDSPRVELIKVTSDRAIFAFDPPPPVP